MTFDCSRGVCVVRARISPASSEFALSHARFVRDSAQFVWAPALAPGTLIRHSHVQGGVIWRALSLIPARWLRGWLLERDNCYNPADAAAVVRGAESSWGVTGHRAPSARPPA